MNCVYKLEYKDFYYIGSTNDFKQRLWDHKSRCFNIKKKEYNYKKYKVFRKLGLTKDNFYKEIKHEILCDKIYEYEMKVLENEFIDLDDVFCLNCCIENLTEEQKKEYQKEYREKNKDKINKKQKEYREKNKDKINKKQRENYLKKIKKKNRKIILYLQKYNRSLL